MSYERVASLSELPDGAVLGVEVDDVRVCLANADGEVYAFSDNCTHRDFPLSNGELDTDECSITCEWHGARFDIRTGAVLGPPRPQAHRHLRQQGGGRQHLRGRHPPERVATGRGDS